MNVAHKILYKLWMGIAVECRFIYPDIISRQGYATVGLKEIKVGKDQPMRQLMFDLFTNQRPLALPLRKSSSLNKNRLPKSLPDVTSFSTVNSSLSLATYKDIGKVPLFYRCCLQLNRQFLHSSIMRSHAPV